MYLIENIYQAQLGHSAAMGLTQALSSYAVEQRTNINIVTTPGERPDSWLIRAFSERPPTLEIVAMLHTFAEGYMARFNQEET